MNRELEQVIMTAMDLPTIPVVATKVMEMVECERTTTEMLAETVANDPAVAARILKLSNSAYYGCQKQIKTLSVAIMIIGFNTLRSLVVAASVKQISNRFGLLEKMLWEHSFGAALAARIIAGKGRLVNEETAFLAGLFHDIGKVILNNHDQDKFQQVMEGCYNENAPFQDVERGIFGFSHTEVGALVIRKWNFPDAISTAVMHHHNFDTTHFADTYERYLTAVTSLANKFCQKFGVGERTCRADIQLATSSEAALLGINEAGMDDCVANFQENFEQTKQMFMS